MNTTNISEKQSLTVRSLTIVKKILDENHEISKIFTLADSYTEAIANLKRFLLEHLNDHPSAKEYYLGNNSGAVQDLSWQNIGVIRLLKYIDNEGTSYIDPNRDNNIEISYPMCSKKQTTYNDSYPIFFAFNL